ncbi:type VII toxin-antitoxin system MntA family adenylyltransferase antitoxin [Natronocalculus amylovorans]|uniref:Nucleotidyltransferase domain-containing protein n=1 Tax=Natronocalculus amylovorans TaxID=2917812 RepID=A0AAE3FYP0_9EURY|nr:nucleotidyltransferase domain-containing protein [Natronocalculus amylovorans]MCL9817726.1 nucleotidyltransferase domain-containing protein [Natronocalculus amylovorans]
MSKSDHPSFETIDLDGIQTYLNQTEVSFAVLFGSHARGVADESSDVDIALQFPDELSDANRFRRRNRIDADLQVYADGFVDVSDIESLPTHVAYAALRDGIRLVGDSEKIATYKRQIDTKYDADASKREREQREFIDRLARGDI